MRLRHHLSYQPRLTRTAESSRNPGAPAGQVLAQNEFRTQRRPLNVAFVLRRTVRNFEEAPALPGLPGSATTRPFGSGGAEWNLVNEGAVGASIFVRVTKGRALCHIAINVMRVWRNELKTSVNVINVTFYLG